MSESEDVSNGGQQSKKPVTLTFEELKVLKECRWNAVLYRGVPAGLVTLAMARTIVKKGYGTRFSGLVYTGSFALAFLTGIGSYRETCVQKILTLENSLIADDLRKRMGLSVEGSSSSGEFSADVLQSLKENNQAESPFNRRLEQTSRWDELRTESRQSQTPAPVPPPPPHDDKEGMSFDELRRRNRSRQGDYKVNKVLQSLTPEEEADLESRKQQSLSKETASYNAKSFYNNTPSALDFSKPEDSRFNKAPETSGRTDDKIKRPIRERIPYKNQYGDEIS